MKPSLKVMAVCLVLAGAWTGALAGGNANFLLGWRMLDEDLWEPTEDQPVFGVTVDFAPDPWPVQLAIGLYGSTDEEELDLGVFGFSTSGEFTASVTELSFGVLKSWEVAGNVHPYVGGGLSFVEAEAELESGSSSVDDDDNSPALYGHGGVSWRLGSRFNIGVDGRFLVGSDIELFDSEGDADYFQIGLLLGWGWPASR